MRYSVSRSSGKAFVDLPSGVQNQIWFRYVEKVSGMYSIPDDVESGLHFVVDSSHFDYLIAVMDNHGPKARSLELSIFRIRT